jgi:hypothetical protein
MFDAHAKPPVEIRDIYKKFQKLDARALDTVAEDFDHREILDGCTIAALPPDLLQIMLNFLEMRSVDESVEAHGLPRVYRVPSVPGKHFSSLSFPISI